MAMTRKDWYVRYYRPLPSNVHLVRVDHRDDELARVFAQVMDLHAFGQMLYHDVLAKQDGGQPFNGKAGWFARATASGWVPAPNKPFPETAVRNALLVFNAHTVGMFERWAKHAKTVTFSSYLSFLRRHNIPISVKPITDPYTHESMTLRRRSATK